MSNKPDKPLSQYIYGIHSSIALLRSNSESIKKILIKRESKNKQLIIFYLWTYILLKIAIILFIDIF